MLLTREASQTITRRRGEGRGPVLRITKKKERKKKKKKRQGKARPGQEKGRIEVCIVSLSQGMSMHDSGAAVLIINFDLLTTSQGTPNDFTSSHKIVILPKRFKFDQ